DEIDPPGSKTGLEYFAWIGHYGGSTRYILSMKDLFTMSRDNAQNSWYLQTNSLNPQDMSEYNFDCLSTLESTFDSITSICKGSSPGWAPVALTHLSVHGPSDMFMVTVETISFAWIGHYGGSTSYTDSMKVYSPCPETRSRTTVSANKQPKSHDMSEYNCVRDTMRGP
ncbi:hypothetical protein J0S82_020157, partial [Galemys pyrenaicus]